MSGICTGSRSQSSTWSNVLLPCCVVIESCRLAGQIITRTAAAAIPAQRSRRHNPIAQMSSASPLR